MSTTPDLNPRDGDLELVEVDDSLAPVRPPEHRDHDHGESEAWTPGDETDDGPAGAAEPAGDES